MKTLTHFFNRLLLAVLAFTLVGISTVNGQDITHPLSGITTTVDFYSHIKRINDTTGIEIKYFVVKGPNSQIKTCFDACDICWGQYKGFAQLNTFMRCVNCGNTYPIDDVGQQGQGNCWPAYLPHTTDANNLILTKADLATGSFMFQQVPMEHIDIGIQANDLPSNYVLKSLQGQILLNMPINAERSIHLVSINGQVLYSAESSSTELVINTKDLASGIYILTIDEEGKSYNQKVWVN